MKKILIPWQLFRQSLVLRTSNNLESWLNRWCYGDDGAHLIGRAVSVNEQTEVRANEQQGVAHAPALLPLLAKAQAKPAPQRAKPIILPVDRRLIDCFHEL